MKSISFKNKGNLRLHESRKRVSIHVQKANAFNFFSGYKRVVNFGLNFFAKTCNLLIFLSYICLKELYEYCTSTKGKQTNKKKTENENIFTSTSLGIDHLKHLTALQK